jgi:thiosulfate/3-mercaptopyruvate sulfurtransferase
MRRMFSLLFLTVLLFAADPWTPRDIVRADRVSKDLKSPLVIHVGFSVLYRSSHIPGSVYAGPASKPEGIEDLKKAVAGQSKDRQILLYCGCCPWDKCPNVRPAFAALHAMGFQNVKVLELPENLKTDWIDKGYPIDKRAE